MLIQLKCKTCDSTLEPLNGENIIECKYCGSRYFLSNNNISDFDSIISQGYDCLNKGDFKGANDLFGSIIFNCEDYNYELYIGFILSIARIRKLENLSNCDFSGVFDLCLWEELYENEKSKNEYFDSLKIDCGVNFHNNIMSLASRDDAFVLDKEDVYLLYVANLKGFSSANDIRKVLNSKDCYDVHEGSYIIACTKENAHADYYLPAIKQASRFGQASLLIAIPYGKEEYVNAILEEFLEYQITYNVRIALVFCNNLDKIKSLKQYCSNVSIQNSDFIIPEAIYFDSSSYIMENQIVLIGGNKSSNDKWTKNSECDATDYTTSDLAGDQEMVDRRAAWIRGKRCRHCGGDFQGSFFSKVCSKCGKRKDY